MISEEGWAMVTWASLWVAARGGEREVKGFASPGREDAAFLE
jgi:hypothetical protein